MTAPESPERGIPSLEEIRSEEEAPFDALFRAYYPRLCGYIHRLTGSPDVAEELVQEVFAAIWKRRRSWSPRGSIGQYLFRAARNRALKYLRDQAARERLRGDVAASIPPPPPLPDSWIGFDEVSRAAHQAIDALPERRRHIFLLSREGALTYVEIAELLGISVKTVETQMGRALRTVRQALRPYLP